MKRIRNHATALFLTLTLAGTAALALGAWAAPINSHPGMWRHCYSAKRWAPAPDHDRPCLYVRLYEDGTFRSQVEQADGDEVRP